MLASVINGDTEDLYSSTYQMSRLLSAEIQFVDALKSYAESTELYSDQVKKFVTDVYADYKPGILIKVLHFRSETMYLIWVRFSS